MVPPFKWNAGQVRGGRRPRLVRFTNHIINLSCSASHAYRWETRLLEFQTAKEKKKKSQVMGNSNLVHLLFSGHVC